MSIRAVGTDGEPLYGEGISNYFTGNNEIAMNLITRLKSVVGDCFFDLNANMDWDNIIGSRNYPIARVNEDLKKVILDTDNISSISSFNSYMKDRVYYANIEIITDINEKLTVAFNTEGII